MTKLHLDFETASTADLKKIGAAAYAAHPDTRIICMAWAFDDEPVTSWAQGMVIPQRIIEHVAAGGTVSGWSLQFEYHIWNSIFLIPRLMPGQLDDTQARAAYYGLPLALEDAGAVLNLPIQKDKAGHTLMLRMARPRAVNPLRWWHVEDLNKFKDLLAYCRRDVEAERAIDKVLDPLPDTEREIWLEDFNANAGGIAVDLNLVKRLDRLAKDHAGIINTELSLITGRKVPTVNNTKSMLGFLRGVGTDLDDLQKETVKTALAGRLGPLSRRVLELRQEAAKTSVAKLPAVWAAAPDGVLRGLLAYYGASRTGRWAGRLVQPQNLPRGVLKEGEVNQALAVVEAGATPDDLELLFGKPALDIVSTLIRSCLVARQGKRLVVADFSQIEARIIAWLAGQDDMLRVFEQDQDVYTHTAARIGSSSRQLGKVLVLACGFGQGHVKFRETAKGYGLDLTLEQCQDAVTKWRAANSKIVQLWWDYERLAKSIASSGGALLSAGNVGKVVFTRRKSTMVINLPSGRELFYHGIDMEDGELVYRGVHPTTKQWGPINTYGAKLAENITQAVARDVMCQTLLTKSNELDLLLTVHDELVCEADFDRAPACIDDLLAGMRTPPPWAADLPVAAAGWIGHRYKKG